MIRRLLAGSGTAGVSAFQRCLAADRLESTVNAEFLRVGLPHDLARLIVEYWRVLPQFGLRVGCWSHAPSGGEPRYMVSLGKSKSVKPMVEFPFDVARSCPAVEWPRCNVQPLHPLTGISDEGMVVIDDDQSQTLTIRFPSMLTFREHCGYSGHVDPFETIGIRYRTDSNSKWILLCQIRNRQYITFNSLADSLILNIDYCNRAPLHHISEIGIRLKMYL